MPDIDELFQQMEKAADKLFDRQWLQHFSHVYWEPEVNVYECREEIVLLMDLPGVAKDEISIHLMGDTLIIEGIRPDPRPPGVLRCLHMEMPLGRFRKQIRIAIPIRKESVKAEFIAGILKVAIPKEGAW